MTEPELSQVLLIIAEKLGIGIQQMYGIFLSAQQTLAILHITFAVLWFVGVIGICWYANKMYKIEKKESSHYDSPEIKYILILIFVVITYTFLLLLVCDATEALVCPQYTALKDMMNSVGSMT